MGNNKMPDINTVLIAGTVVEEPTLSRTESGRSIGFFQISNLRRFRDNSGQWRENRCQVGVVVYQKLAELCQRNLRPGSPVLLDGELQSRNVEDETGSRTVLEIRARRVQFLERGMRVGPKEASEAESAPERPTETQPQAEAASEVLPEEPTTSEFDFGYRDLEL